MIYETLTRNARFLAKTCKYSSRNSVRSILLCSVELDNRSAAEHRMVSRVVFLRIVRMPSVSVVSRNHESTLHCLIISLLSIALSKSDALQHE